MSSIRMIMRAVRPVWRAAALGAVVLGVAGIATDARAAGFQLKEQSANALGNAFAGSTAGAEDLSYMFFNPAAMAYQSGHQVLAVGSLIMPSAEMQSGSASDNLSNSISGGLGGDAGSPAGTLALYAMWDLSPELKIGFGINTPFGLKTEYDDSWIGRYHGIDSELLTIDINPAAAYRVNDMISVGAGVSIQYAEATLTNAIDYGTIAGIGSSTATDGSASLEGDSWGFGGNVGVLVEPAEGLRFGAAYRSRIEHDIEGDVDFTDDGAGVVGLIRAGAGDASLFTDSGASADLTLPDIISAGVHYDVNSELAVMAEFAYTLWSTLDELRIQFDNTSQPDNVTVENWDDSFFVAMGATWRPDDRWTVRGGVAFDETPVPDATRTPRIPGESRTWVAFGGQYNYSDMITVDAGYAHLFVSDSTLSLTTADSNNTFRGNLSGTYEHSVDILTVQLKVRF